MYLWIDMFTILPLAILMSRTEPYPELHPGRPLTQLLLNGPGPDHPTLPSFAEGDYLRFALFAS